MDNRRLEIFPIILFYFIPSLTAFLVFVFNCFSFVFHPFILSFFIDLGSCRGT